MVRLLNTLDLEADMYFQLYQSDVDHKWHWNLRADNHQTIADGARPYASRQAALRMILLVQNEAGSAPIYDGSKEKWL